MSLNQVIVLQRLIQYWKCFVIRNLENQRLGIAWTTWKRKFVSFTHYCYSYYIKIQ